VATSSDGESHRPIGVQAPPVHYVDWPAILAGSVLAMALSFVLLAFGSAIGLSMASVQPGEGVSLRWIGIASGLWFIWVAITCFCAGGYLAGRLRRPVPGASSDEVEVRDGAHGLLVWATGAVLGVLLATAGVSGAVGAAGRAAATAAETATEAVGGSLDFMGARLLQGAQGGGGREAREDVTTVLTRSLADGELDAEDRTYIVGMLAERTGRSAEDVGAQVDAAVAEAHQAYEQALEVAEQARRATAIGAFVIAATMLCSAAAAYFAATLGGDHRDRNVPFRTFGR
jgi:hypothetical protein